MVFTSLIAHCYVDQDKLGGKPSTGHVPPDTPNTGPVPGGLYLFFVGVFHAFLETRYILHMADRHGTVIWTGTALVRVLSGAPLVYKIVNLGLKKKRWATTTTSYGPHK